MTQFLPLGSSHPSQRKRLVITDHIPPPGADYNEVNRDERGLYSATMERERRNRFRQLTYELDFEERRGVFQTEDITNTGFVLAGAWRYDSADNVRGSDRTQAAVQHYTGFSVEQKFNNYILYKMLISVTLEGRGDRGRLAALTRDQGPATLCGSCHRTRVSER
ncbi:uncharacterized protein LOC102152591 isoform X2 [Canis lupus familiaris]|uniref:uncharacterized protein LOC102152591 isoform X2 n=1 Tax=Canis lupus familiaris TaxID=9615 RepID=UPI0015F1B9F4|nr:uncharacterized protein LOC102152591 isoform X2 [Canis lupus familiaris]XP_038397875.1 uncharacterized protein LOC102152591 isoform X2 [Canis lupus familiaris]XP_038526710.1 uncharacterized protein LOC102152591 isoform X2 [Canis lupus familiaris]